VIASNRCSSTLDLHCDAAGLGVGSPLTSPRSGGNDGNRGTYTSLRRIGFHTHAHVSPTDWHVLPNSPQHGKPEVANSQPPGGAQHWPSTQASASPQLMQFDPQ
jgi:hypothetical protein